MRSRVQEGGSLEVFTESNRGSKNDAQVNLILKSSDEAIQLLGTLGIHHRSLLHPLSRKSKPYITNFTASDNFYSYFIFYNS